MIVKVNGNVKPYYIQTLAMIFFPGAKFPENEEITPETVVLTLDMTETDEAVRSVVTIAQGDRSVTAEAAAAWTKSEDRDHVRKLSSGEALLDAGAKFTGYTPPWGILTGVVPFDYLQADYPTPAVPKPDDVRSVQVVRDVTVKFKNGSTLSFAYNPAGGEDCGLLYRLEGSNRYYLTVEQNHALIALADISFAPTPIPETDPPRGGDETAQVQPAPETIPE